MLLFRLLTTGLCLACVVMLATIQPVRFLYVERAPSRVDRLRSVTAPGVGPASGEAPYRGEPSCGDRPPVSVVDVASGVAPEALAALVHLGPGERVSAVNDRALGSDLEAGALIASRAPHAGEFLDLTVSSETTERRVLVLMH